MQIRITEYYFFSVQTPSEEFGVVVLVGTQVVNRYLGSFRPPTSLVVVTPHDETSSDLDDALTYLAGSIVHKQVQVNEVREKKKNGGRPSTVVTSRKIDLVKWV